MTILLVSQCEKRALKETRRILDQFAERRGERTWQTSITQAGLDTLRMLLRRTARKNTAVACHWIRGLDHSELLWIVGDTRQFNREGAVSTNTTARDVRRAADEAGWHHLGAIAVLAQLAALLHDLGKASAAFQKRLRHPTREKNLYRHEWVSLRLFQAFVTGAGDDDAGWLRRLVEGDFSEADWTAPEHFCRDGMLPKGSDATRPLEKLPPLARAIGWLILTHHRLPTLPVLPGGEGVGFVFHGMSNKRVEGRDLDKAHLQVRAFWNEPQPLREAGRRKDTAAYWSFPYGLPVGGSAWRMRAARLAQKLLVLAEAELARDWLADPFLMHIARLCLMLGDHHYSGLGEAEEAARAPFRSAVQRGNMPPKLYANTSGEGRALNQGLDEHLLGVAAHAGQLAHALPALAGSLNHLRDCKPLKKRSGDPAFRWQDRASDLAASLREQAAEHGAFIVNMASTGCGKTLGNARIMNALADPARGLRCAFAIGLRTLTLQTGRAFQKRLGLTQEVLAILVGGSGSRELFEWHEREAESRGAASAQDLLEEDSEVFYEGTCAPEGGPVLPSGFMGPRLARLLAAPILACTVDHLTPATESLRGGRQIAPMLRLLSGDLVLDEPDDFDIDDLPALTRLVHWAGLLGSRVLLSSATLPPALIEGLFLAYREGRTAYQRNRGRRPQEPVSICCLWTDEFSQQHKACSEAQDFRAAHEGFARKRARILSKQPVRRIAELLPFPSQFATQERAARRDLLARLLRDAALRLHAVHHSIDPQDAQRRRRVSFGLLRMANIDPLFDVALALFAEGAPQGTHIHLCPYHSRFPLFLRSRIERQLDSALDRHDEQAVFARPDIRQRIDAYPDATDHLFIVLGSPVTEVGRDHDYDWAVVEPSSMRSLIQLLGRILRHRSRCVAQPNVLILETNLRYFECAPGSAVYCRPGFEMRAGPFQLRYHDLHTLLTELLDAEGRMTLDARPRILEADVPRPRECLADLEHARLRAQMLPATPTVPPAAAASSAPAPAHTAGRRRPRGPQPRGDAAPAPTLNASSYWSIPYATLTGLLQQRFPFREQTRPEIDVVFLPDEEEEAPVFRYRFNNGKRRTDDPIYPPIESSLEWVSDASLNGPNITAWGTLDLLAAMREQAEAMGLPLVQFAQKFATASLPKNGSTTKWRFHTALGFSTQG